MASEINYNKNGADAVNLIGRFAQYHRFDIKFEPIPQSRVVPLISCIFDIVSALSARDASSLLLLFLTGLSERTTKTNEDTTTRQPLSAANLLTFLPYSTKTNAWRKTAEANRSAGSLGSRCNPEGTPSWLPERTRTPYGV